VVVLREGTSVLLPKKNVFSATLFDFTGFRESYVENIDFSVSSNLVLPSLGRLELFLSTFALYLVVFFNFGEFSLS
jgi:hypothetical protein